MTTLDVIEVQDSALDLSTLPVEERELLIEQSLKQLQRGDLEQARVHFDALLDTINTRIEWDNLIDKPAMPTLVMRKIIIIAHYLARYGFSQFARVLVPNFKVFNKAEFIKDTKEGGGVNKYAKRLNKNTKWEKQVEKVEGTDIVMFPFIVSAETLDGAHSFNITTDEKFNMAGVTVDEPSVVDSYLDQMRRIGIIADMARFTPAIGNHRITNADNIEVLYNKLLSLLHSILGGNAQISAEWKTNVVPFVPPPKVALPADEYDADIGRVVGEITRITSVSVPSGAGKWVCLDNIRFFDTLAAATEHGADSPIVRDKIAAENDNLKRKEFHRRQVEARLEGIKELAVWRAIIEQKFGPEVSRMVEKKIELQPPANPADILKYLTGPQQEAVKLERARRTKYIESVINNKCPHVPIYNRLRDASITDVSRGKMLAELLEYAPKDAKYGRAADASIKCTSCGFDLICPHVVESIQSETLPFAEMFAKLQNYIDRKERNDSYYCRICGELISSSEGLELPDTHSDAQDEELRNAIWGEIMNVLRGLKFSSIVNLGQIASAGRDMIYQYVYDVDTMVRKSKLSTADEIKNKIKFTTAIYAVAYVIHLVVSNLKSKTVKIEVIGFTPSGKNIVADLIRHMIGVIMSTRNIVIREIPGMSADIVKVKLVEAYKSLATSTSAEVVYNATDEVDVVTQFMLDPVYAYVYNMWAQSKGLIDNKAKHLDEILGMKATKLNRAPYSELKINYGRLAPAPIARDSFKLFMEYLNDDIYTKFVHYDTAIDGKFQYAADFTPEFAAYNEKLAQLLAAEAKIEADNALFPALDILNTATGARFSRRDVALGRIYDAAGKPHKWNIFVVDGKDMTLEQIVAKRKASEQFSIEDRKCSICGAAWSKADEIPVADIIESVRSKTTQANFFIFFDIRCPEEGSHEFDSKGVCSKCGLKRGEQSMSYFKKYRDVYIAARATTVSELPKYTHTVKLYEDYTKWTFNFNVLLNLAEKIEVSANAINCLGATEHQEYKNVTNGEYIPPDAADRLDTRIYILKSHIKNLYLNWNRLCGLLRLNKIPVDLLGVLEAAGVNKGQLGDITGALTPLEVNDYSLRIEYFRLNKKPREAVMFALQTYCELCLQVLTDGDKRTEKLRYEFVKYIVRDALRGDERLTKPGQFNWNILKGLDIERDANIEADEEEEEVDVEDREDPFKGIAEMDVEDADRDPEDDANQIRVGEDYGLD